MFISALELFKIGIGPSSSHTMGPMIAAGKFLESCKAYFSTYGLILNCKLRCSLKGSLAFTGRGHHSDRAVALGLHGYSPGNLAEMDVDALVARIWNDQFIIVDETHKIAFSPVDDVIFDQTETLPEHPNGMIFELFDDSGATLISETYFSIGGGFVDTLAEISQLVAPLKMESDGDCAYPFDTASSMLEMAEDSGLSIPEMKRVNELQHPSVDQLDNGLDTIWHEDMPGERTGCRRHFTGRPSALTTRQDFV